MKKIIKRCFGITLVLILTSLQSLSAQASPSLNFNEFNIPFSRIGAPTTTMQVTPDNQTVFFRVFETQNRAAIYRALVSNPAAVERVSVAANSNSINGTDFRFTINSSGSHLLYTVQASPQNQFQLYSYNIATRQNIRLSGVNSSTRPRFVINETENQVVFIEVESGIGRLVAAPINGSTPAQVLATTEVGQTLGTSFLEGDFFIAENSQRVLYYLESDSGDQRDLFSVNLDANDPTPVKLNSLPNNDADQIQRLQLFNNDSQVIYRVTNPNSNSNLFSVPVDASSAPLQVSEQQIDSLGVRARAWFVGNQEQRVIYTVGSSSNSRLLSSTLETTPIHTRLDNDTNRILNLGLLSQIPQTNQITYLSESPPDSDLIDLYRVDVSGGVPQKINDDGTEVLNTYFGNGSTFLYTRQQRDTAADFQFQLIRYDALTNQNEVLTPARPYPTSISPQSILSPNGEFIYLVSNLANENQSDLFQVPISGSGAVVMVNQAIPNDHFIDLNTIIINDSLIVYRHRGPDGIATPYFVNREPDDDITFFVIKARNGNTFVIGL